MGLFSKCCAKTNLPVLYAQGLQDQPASRLTEVVVLLPGRKPFEAVYDGYGLGLDNWGEAKLVLKSAYAGETYEMLPPSEDEPNQGYFLSRELMGLLAEIPCLPDVEAYLDLCRAEDEARDELVKTRLGELKLSAPQGLKAYRVEAVLACIRHACDDPSSELVLSRYKEALASHPAFAAMFPENPLDAAHLVEQFFPRVSDGVSAALRRKAAPYLARQDN